MRLLGGNTFARKITTTVLLTTGMALATLTAALLMYDSISARASLQSRLSTLADVIGQNSTAALNFYDPPAAVEVLEALRAEPQVVSACLYDLSGKLFAQYHRERESADCPSVRARAALVVSTNPQVLRPVLRHNELVGTLFMVSDLHDLEQRRHHLLWVAGCLMLIALALGGALGFLLQGGISKPILELVRAMREVTAGSDFKSTLVPVSGSEEIEQLGIGFNTMLSELARRDDAKRSAEAKLQFQALNDALTGLPNRRLLSDRLEQVLATARRASRMVSLLYIDLDGFKLVNDSLGHSVGDALLVQVAARLQSRVRQSDTLARLGGDEFTVVLASLHDKDEALLVARKLLQVLADPFVIGDHELTIGASIGISIFPDNAQNAGDLLQQADSAMYSAKREGKNRAAFFTPQLGTWVRERLNLENQLRGAILRGEIHVHYQPEFDVVSHRIVRFEALARWVHPTLGNIPPIKFIPVAEESGLIIALGSYVMERACTEAVLWQTASEYPIQVAVNVSSVQFKRDSFVQEVSDILGRTGLKPELLQLELTESIMLSGVHQAADTMNRLHAMGVSFAIDDFGTGYSCLSYLQMLPFDALKIDRSFVKELGSKPESRIMVKSLVAFAHNVGMRVIVEGVEETDQLELIKGFGGNEIQGYLMGRPTADPQVMLASHQLNEPVMAQPVSPSLEPPKLPS